MKRREQFRETPDERFDPDFGPRSKSPSKSKRRHPRPQREDPLDIDDDFELTTRALGAKLRHFRDED